MKLEDSVLKIWSKVTGGDGSVMTLEDKGVIDSVMDLLSAGEVRVAEKHEGAWLVNAWVKQAILLYFRMLPKQVMQTDVSLYQDVVPSAFSKRTIDATARVVPPAYVRHGAFVGEQVVLMPSFVNIGAYIDTGCMIDTWATVGSCAQIGKHVHVSGGAGIGGVLEPIGSKPTIIEDDCFIGARSEIVEGVVVGRNSIISMGVFIGKSTKIYNRETGCISQGYVPPNSVVVPGSLPSACGQYALNAAIIVKQVDARVKAKVMLNELLHNL